jgi:2-keto-3-deoxy-L-rhamnonate aldolase RhmA
VSIIGNHTKKLLQAGELATGMGVRALRGVEVGKIAKTCGYDFLFIDLEHSALNLETAADISVAAMDAGCTPVVRASSHAHHHASRPLDSGAQGIVVPHVNTVAEAESVAAHCLYPPLGHRSVAGGAAQLDYQSIPVGEATTLLNAETLVVVMLESPQAIENADAIAAVDGVDVLLIGTNDLCAEMGIPGQFDHDDVVAAYDRTISACRNNGKVAGMGGVYSELAARYIGMGVRMVLAGGDLNFLMSAASARNDFLRGLMAE